LEEKEMKSFKIAQVALLFFFLLALPATSTSAQQPIYPVSFSLNPSVFAVNSNVSTLACVSVSGPSNSIQVRQGNVLIFVFDPSIGTVSLPGSPTVTLTNAAASPVVPPQAVSADFSVAQGVSNPNKVTITYNDPATKNLPYGTNICTQVNIATAATPGPALVRFSSQLSTISGNLPSVSASLVNFATGNSSSFVFMSNIVFPSIPTFFTPLNATGDLTTNRTFAGNGDGFTDGAAPMPGTCTFDSLKVAATTSGAASFPYTFTFWKNDSPTSLTCNLVTPLAAGTVTCEDTTHTVSVVAGDMVAVMVDQPGSIGNSPQGNIGISLHCK
jgi:hypothetical protein